MAWSSGVAYAIPVLAFGNDIPEETRRKVGPYFRKFVVFGMFDVFLFYNLVRVNRYSTQTRRLGHLAPHCGPRDLTLFATNHSR